MSGTQLHISHPLFFPSLCLRRGSLLPCKAHVSIHSIPVVLKLLSDSELPGELNKIKIAGYHPKVSDSNDLGYDSSICISQLPSDADAAGPGIIY